MQSRIMTVSLLSLALVVACARRAPTPQPDARPTSSDVTFVESGFLTTDYALLRPVEAGAARHVYRNPDAPLSRYDELFVDRITIWRDHDQQEPVESADFQKIVDGLHTLVVREMGKKFTLVDEPAPGVARMRIGLVAIDHPDDKLDVYVSHGDAALSDSDKPLPVGLRTFGRKAWLEGEMLDATTHQPIFAVVDRVTDVIPRKGPIETWHDLHQAFEAWAKQGAERVAALKERD